MLPIPPDETEGTSESDPTYTNYDEKWNVDDKEVQTEEPEEQVPMVTKEMPATMVLVIGIILGAFVAMVLIVIIGIFLAFKVFALFHCVRIV